MKINGLKKQLTEIKKILKTECPINSNENQLLELIMLSARAEMFIRNPDIKITCEISEELEKVISKYYSNKKIIHKSN